MKVVIKIFGFIYITTNLINDKKYIGKCEYNRQNGWEDYLGSGKIIKLAIKKYGVKNFSREIIYDAINLDDLNMAEKYYISLYDACHSDKFYNIADGGSGGNTRLGYSEKEYEAYCKQFSKPSEENAMYGKHHSDKSKKQDGEKTKLRFQDKTFKEKHSKAVKEAMKHVDKEKLAYENRSKNTLIKCEICGKEEYVYTSQQKYCSECKKKYSRWKLSQIVKNC